MPTIIQDAIYRRVWDILLARPVLAEAIKPSNRRDSRDVMFDAWLATRSRPSDFPNLSIVDTNKVPTQAMTVFEGYCPSVETFDVTLRNDRKTAAIEAEIEAAVLSQPANLVLLLIKSFTWMRTRRATDEMPQYKIDKLFCETVYSFRVECAASVAEKTE